MAIQPLKTSSRIKSIDALRGFDMFFIIGGEKILESLAKIWPGPVTAQIAHQLKHVGWDGFHFEDLIWPLFLFLMGIVLPLSMSRRLTQTSSRRKIYRHILIRAITLIILGWMLRGLLNFDWQQMNWTSVLGRIGFCYALAAMLVLNTNWRTQAWIMVIILISYYAAMKIIPVPGYGAGDLSRAGNLARYMDNLILPAGKAFRFKDSSVSILGTLLATCSVLMGVMAGHWLNSGRTAPDKAKGLLMAGIACLVAGALWNFSFPINKKLWTSSFVLFSGGWNLSLMALFYWIIDVKKYENWCFFFVVIGCNALAIYFFQAVINFSEIAEFFVRGIILDAAILDILILAIATLTVKWLLLYFLFKKKIFIKV